MSLYYWFFVMFFGGFARIRRNSLHLVKKSRRMWAEDFFKVLFLSGKRFVGMDNVKSLVLNTQQKGY